MGYEWLRRWNEDSFEGLILKFSGVRPPELIEVQKDDQALEVKKKITGRLFNRSQPKRIHLGEYKEKHLNNIHRDERDLP